jgi:hypothetical protein
VCPVPLRFVGSYLLLLSLGLTRIPLSRAMPQRTRGTSRARRRCSPPRPSSSRRVCRRHGPWRPFPWAPVWLTTRAVHACTEDGELQVDIADDDDDVDEHAEIRYVKDGDTIKLLHVATNKLLNSHDVASAMNPSRQEVRVVYKHTRTARAPSWIRKGPTVLCVWPPGLQVSGWDSTEKLAGQTEWRIKVKKNKGNGIIPFKYEMCVGRVSTWRVVVDIRWDALPAIQDALPAGTRRDQHAPGAVGRQVAGMGLQASRGCVVQGPCRHAHHVVHRQAHQRQMYAMHAGAGEVSVETLANCPWLPMAFAVPSVQSDAIPTLSFTEKLFELINEMTEANARLTSKVSFSSPCASRPVRFLASPALPSLCDVIDFKVAPAPPRSMCLRLGPRTGRSSCAGSHSTTATTTRCAPVAIGQ